MKTTLTTLLLVSLSWLLGACSSEPPETEAKQDTRHVWSDQTDTIDRAKAVEDTLQKAAEERRKALEAMEQ
jgi:outer membrane biogenesis lipoprotein LolB